MRFFIQPNGFKLLSKLAKSDDEALVTLFKSFFKELLMLSHEKNSILLFKTLLNFYLKLINYWKLAINSEVNEEDYLSSGLSVNVAGNN